MNSAYGEGDIVLELVTQRVRATVKHRGDIASPGAAGDAVGKGRLFPYEEVDRDGAAGEGKGASLGAWDIAEDAIRLLSMAASSGTATSQYVPITIHSQCQLNVRLINNS
jgi:hypothetical protein